jgi:hypothetical protein
MSCGSQQGVQCTPAKNNWKPRCCVWSRVSQSYTVSVCSLRGACVCAAGHSAKLSTKICLWSSKKASHLLRSSWQNLPIIVSSRVDGRILITQICDVSNSMRQLQASSKGPQMLAPGLGKLAPDSPRHRQRQIQLHRTARRSEPTGRSSS